MSGAVPPDERPALSSALRDLDQGRADVLVVASVSRLGRRTLDLLDLADRAQANGWGLAVLGLEDITTPVGEFAFTLQAAVAEYERASAESA